MSLEAKIEALTAAVSNLTSVIQKIEAAQGTQAPTITAPAVAAAPVVTAPLAPPVAPAPAPVVQAPAVTMPPPPSFAAPVAPPVAAAPAPTGVPFNDAKGLMAYAMALYQALGPQKGAQIQDAMRSLGIQNINETKPEQYAALYNAFEQLKGAA